MLILAISFITRFFFFLLLNFALFSSIAPKTLFVLVAFCHAVVSFVAVKPVFWPFCILFTDFMFLSPETRFGLDFLLNEADVSLFSLNRGFRVFAASYAAKLG